MASRDPTREDNDEEAMLDAGEVGEEIGEVDEDAPMGGVDSEDEVEGGGVEEALELQNDSIAHFDKHGDSVFTISSHPRQPLLVATGSGDDTTFVWSADPQPDLLPKSFQGGVSGQDDADDNQEPGRASLASVVRLEGHSDSVIATQFSRPSGDYLITAGMDGKVRIYNATSHGAPARDADGYSLAAEAQEVEEVTWLASCPNADRPNVFAFGGNDGSVWVYEIQGAAGGRAELQVLQVFYQHTSPCTAGAWSASGALLATVSEESSLYVFDPFGLVPGGSNAGTAAVVAVTAEDQRFAVEGGLYSVAITPGGTLCAVGGQGGSIRVVGLPRTSTDPASQTTRAGGKQKGSGGQAAASGAGGQLGQIVASLSTGGDSVETLAFSPTGALLAAGDVDGNIRLFDTAHNFALRRHLQEAHENQAVVDLQWEGADAAPGSAEAAAAGTASILFSCGMDGVLRKWDAKTGTMLKEFKGHRGGGEGGGIMGFVLINDDDGKQLAVTAGDDSVSLVFNVST